MTRSKQFNYIFRKEKKMGNKNLGDKFQHRVTLRLTDEQYEFLINVSSVLGVSPSDYIRMSVNAGMVAMKNDINDIRNGNAISSTAERLVGTSDENVKANIDNKL